MIGIIDYGSGNIKAIENIYKRLDIAHCVLSNDVCVNQVDKYILPGVGHFCYTMNHIKEIRLYEALYEQVMIKKKPLLGICVGMQLLADFSEEGGAAGFGWIPGRVAKIHDNLMGVKLPHMGWNSIVIRNDLFNLFKNIDTEKGFYFLHSYQYLPSSSTQILATTEYGQSIVCAVSNNENIFGVQFHPEKSHTNGITILKNYSNL